MITLIFTNLVIELTSAVSDIGSNEPTTGKKVKVFIFGDVLFFLNVMVDDGLLKKKNKW